MAKPKHEEKGSMSSSDTFGIGMLDNGKLNVVPKGELAARIAARNAEEEVDGEDDGDVDELAEKYSGMLNEPPEAI